jgi:hypothetical protein
VLQLKGSQRAAFVPAIAGESNGGAYIGPIRDQPARLLAGIE